MNIGLALSGGGFRACGFHLGVLKKLADENLLEKVKHLSTVSGGSLCVGLVMTVNGFEWPSSKIFLTDVLPQAKTLLTTVDLQKKLIFRTLLSPFRLFDSRADDLSELLQNRWGITLPLSRLPAQPRWSINAACYETGKNWRFEKNRIGDYQFGYSEDTDLPLSDALAASAGFPGLIGPLELATSKRSWYRLREVNEGQFQRDPITPSYNLVHLWDGGAYDNHGIEILHNFDSGLRRDINYIIVSDAAGRGKPEAYKKGLRALYRLGTAILMEQVRSLRTRSIMSWLLANPGSGLFLQIGNSCREVLDASRTNNTFPCDDYLSQEQTRNLAEMGTHIRRLTCDEFDNLVRHGYEVAEYTMRVYPVAASLIDNRELLSTNKVLEGKSE